MKRLFLRERLGLLFFYSILDTFLRGFIKNYISFQPNVKYKFPLSNLFRRAVACFLTLKLAGNVKNSHFLCVFQRPILSLIILSIRGIVDNRKGSGLGLPDDGVINFAD